jgi:predicted Zn-dependent protease
MAKISRIGLLVLALAAGAWFALGVRQARDTAQATALVSGSASLSPQQAQRARSLLHSAATLNPDLTLDLLSGQLAFDQRRYRPAERIDEWVTRQEPLNLTAWSQLAFAAARAGDRRTLERAARQVSALYPTLK